MAKARFNFPKSISLGRLRVGLANSDSTLPNWIELQPDAHQALQERQQRVACKAASSFSSSTTAAAAYFWSTPFWLLVAVDNLCRDPLGGTIKQEDYEMVVVSPY